jgi:hypothetical protein
MSPSGENVAFSLFGYGDAGTSTAKKHQSNLVQNKDEQIAAWRREAARYEGKIPQKLFNADLGNEPFPYNEAMAHFGAADVIAIFVATADIKNSDVILKAQELQDFMKLVLGKTLPIVEIDASGVDEGRAPTISALRTP